VRYPTVSGFIWLDQQTVRLPRMCGIELTGAGGAG